MSHAELIAATNFSFLRGASHAFEMVAQAATLGLSGIGICDRNSLSGVVRAYSAARDLAKDFPTFKLVVGARLVFADGTPDIAVYPSDREAYGRLAALLTLGNRRAPKGECHLELQDLLDHSDGQLMIVIPDADLDRAGATASWLSRSASGRVWLAAACRYGGEDRARLAQLAEIAAAAEVPLLATMDALYHEPSRSRIADVLTCIREGVTIFEAGQKLSANSERHIKSPAEMARLFREHPDALAQSRHILYRISFSLDQLRYIYPEETVGNGETAQQTLERLSWEGAERRYPDGIPERVRKGL
ncbi:PHP domain-containing protein, partial [Paradevosia shaoguanensis]